MDKTITDTSGKVISEQAALLLESHEIIYRTNGVIKKIEKIRPNARFPKHIIYYMAEDENHAEVLSSLTEQSSSFEIIKTKACLDLEIQTSRSYMDGEYAGTVKVLYKNQRQLCWQELDLSEEPKHADTEKYYRDRAGNTLLTFFYDNAGAISSIDGEPAFDPFDNGVHSVSEEEFTHYNPDFLEVNPYYKDATFLQS